MSKKKPETSLKNGLESGPGRAESDLGRPGKGSGGPKKGALAVLGGPGTGPRLPALPSGRPKKHGGFSFISSGKLPEHRREVSRYLTAVREGLVNDFGPLEADLSTSQLMLINEITTSAGFLRLVEEYVREVGAIGPDGELRHCLSAFYLALLNSQRLNILALKNIGRRERPAPSLADLIKTIDAEAGKDGPAMPMDTAKDPRGARGLVEGSLKSSGKRINMHFLGSRKGIRHGHRPVNSR